MQTIIKKKLNSFYPDLGARILMGDVRGPMAQSTIDQCERIIDRFYGSRDEIWLLIYSYPELQDKRVIRTKILILSEQPPKMLGTVCFYVDYRISDVELLWALPLDTARDPRVISDQGAERIITDAAGLPVIN